MPPYFLTAVEDVDMRLRDATPDDAVACAAIYASYVTDTAITFELDPPTPAEFAERIRAAVQRHAWVIAEDADTTLGYAYAGPMKPRAAYRFSCEVSVYLDPARRGRGTGRALYEALFERLAARGFRTAVAGMTLPNRASEGLHAALGFVPVGVFRRVGWKHGAWHDVAWVQRRLGADGPPAELS